MKPTRILLGAVLLCGSIFSVGHRNLKKSARSSPPETLAATETALRRDVAILATEIGPRSPAVPAQLERAADFVAASFKAAGYPVENRTFRARGQTLRNIVAIRPGTGPAIVVGAHYDSVSTSPGADDNASGTAVLLELARRARSWAPGSPIYFVAFSNEETGQIRDMGSAHYAAEIKPRGESVKAMICLEMLGYYDSRKGSQKYPPVVSWFYPNKGDFVALVSNVSSRGLLKAFRRPLKDLRQVSFNAAILPDFIGGIDRSDHMNFWAHGIPAMMVTDTAFYRNSRYHLSSDRAETLNYNQMAKLADALDVALRHYSGSAR